MEMTKVSTTVVQLPQSANAKAAQNRSDTSAVIKQKQSSEVYTPSERPPVKEMTEEERNEYIDELRQKSEYHFESLKNLVRKMLEKQGNTFQDIHDGKIDWETFEVDDETRAEAAAAIADNGPYGAEATSNRIVNFAVALSGGNPDKLAILRDAINDGFSAVKDIFGDLPEVSERTYTLVHDKLDAWEKEQRGEFLEGNIS
ncbi:hypothetical protein [Salisediminibacterium beveridgei]|uniref:hypothetical protein n=1 Tax=Salisediminibacterium beveridgei TaxID=632773 RepID=UPI000848088E|nr:hypothetical protein [Salisediminibacterium beveridgei]